MTTPPLATPDPRRWWTLTLLLVGITLVCIDTTVLNVAVPTIRREFDASLPAVEWVLTGFALVFASLLVLGGRLGDLFGARRLAVVGVGIFGVGSLIAAVAPNVGTLILGAAVIEGIGASLLLPSSMSLITRMFTGNERTTAFAASAAALSSGSILGPLIGGFLTTYHSWRWAYGMNVIAAPLVVIGLLTVSRRDDDRGVRQRFDVPGTALVTLGAFLVVFGLSQGTTYGYLRPLARFTIAGLTAWPGGAPISVVPVAIVLGALALAAFVKVERATERRGGDPLFAMSQFATPTFAAASAIGGLIAFAQLGSSFTLALYLQASHHLTPMQNGLWIMPSGLASVAGSPVGGWLGRRVDAMKVFRVGLTVHALALVAEALVLRTSLSYIYVLAPLALYGFGNGIVMSQLNRVLLHDIAPTVAGAASGMATTIRQGAAASGIAASGAVFAASSKHFGIHAAIAPAMLMSATALLIGAVMAWRVSAVGDEPMTPRGFRSDAETLVETDAQLGGVALILPDADR